MMPTLGTRLDRAGQPVRFLTFADGTRVLVLPAGGRLLGLYPPESDDNFLWTNPALARGATARTCFDRTGWINPGGDRTWLAPEIELFIGDLTRPGETYAVQPALDPGCWTLTSATDTELCLTNATRLRLHRAGQQVGVRLCKHHRPAANPLQFTALAGAGLQYAGYTQVTTIELEPVVDASIRLGIWNLLQLPLPGVMLIPTRFAVQPQVMFGTPSAAALSVAPHLVRWEMADSSANAKVGINAQPLTGRAGYLRQNASGGTADLVVREFAVDPNGDYVDALWEHPHEPGWVFQACCVRVGEDRFNELEYHAPAVTAAAGSNHGRDESRVWAFRGPGPAIAEAAATLLGESSIPPLPNSAGRWEFQERKVI